MEISNHYKTKINNKKKERNDIILLIENKKRGGLYLCKNKRIKKVELL